MLFSVNVASLSSSSHDRMSVSTLYNNQDHHEKTLQKYGNVFPIQNDKPYGCRNVVSSSMARGHVIECCEPESVDNPTREPLEKRPGASPSVIESMKLESNRLQSFTSRWPLNFVKTNELAAVGLFYLGLSDSVQCAFCHGIISDWEEGDQPLREHVRHFPMCPFLLNCKVGNVPISGVNGRQKWQVEPSHAECGGRMGPVSESARTVNSFKPKHPAMGSFDKRLASFQDWPSSSPLTPSQLAEAGLFYSNVDDVTTCFCCGGALGSWSPGDNAWTEHARYFPECSYVKCTKGSQFTESARQSSSDVMEPSSCNSAQYVEPLSSEPKVVDIVNKQNEASGERETLHSSEGDTKFLCKICMDEGARAVFVPCGHSLACLKCAANLTSCPLCRKPIQSSIRLYFDD